ARGLRGRGATPSSHSHVTTGRDPFPGLPATAGTPCRGLSRARAPVGSIEGRPARARPPPSLRQRRDPPLRTPHRRSPTGTAHTRHRFGEVTHATAQVTHGHPWQEHGGRTRAHAG